MGPRNFLNLRLQSSPKANEFGDELEAARLPRSASHEKPQSRPSERSRRGRSYDLLRIPKLLMLGYASEDTQRRYERQRDWKRFYSVLMFKIENITIVSGLLLASSCNLLIVGDLRRMTHAAVSASMFGSILSIVFGLLCRINITPGRLEFLVNRSRLFYYLYATPSLWGGAAALVFFVAVCAFTWLEESTAKYGWEAKAAAVILSGLLIANAIACFVLGAGVMETPAGVPNNAETTEDGKKSAEEGFDELEERNRRSRVNSEDMAPSALAFSSFGITAWDAGRQWPSSGDQDSVSSLPSTRAPTRAATVDSTGAPARPRRAYTRRQSEW